MYSSTHVFVEGTHGALGYGIDVLEGPSGEAQHQVQLFCGASHQVEVMTGRDGGGTIRPFISRLCQIWVL